MFSMKGKYVKGEDLSNLVNEICDMRVSSKDDVILNSGKVKALAALNLLDEQQGKYILETLNCQVQKIVLSEED